MQALRMALLALLISLLPSAVFASETVGTIEDPSAYAWGETIGWVNFGLAQGNVLVEDDGLTGYAWNDNAGWIHLNPSATSRVTNDAEGTLGGYAWSEIWGWIDFDGVVIDENGTFSGYASLLSDDSQINVSCRNTDSCDDADFSLATDWRPSSTREGIASSGSSGGGSGGGSSPPVSEDALLLLVEPAEVAILDVVPDGEIGVLDFNALMVQWDVEACGISGDMNQDCRVDVLDFNQLMVHWGLTYAL